jgi:hypothetical protein
MLIGVAAAGAWTTDILAFAAAAFAGFLLRQPVTILVKIRSGRRPAHDLRPALVWAIIDSVIVAVAATAVVRNGHARVLVLAGRVCSCSPGTCGWSAARGKGPDGG